MTDPTTQEAQNTVDKGVEDLRSRFQVRGKPTSLQKGKRHDQTGESPLRGRGESDRGA